MHGGGVAHGIEAVDRCALFAQSAAFFVGGDSPACTQVAGNGLDREHPGSGLDHVYAWNRPFAGPLLEANVTVELPTQLHWFTAQALRGVLGCTDV